MKYVVYVHKDNCGTIFYVGHGTMKRAYSLELSETSGKGTGRGKKYSEFVKSISFDYTCEVIKSNMTKKEAEEYECNLYDVLIEKYALVNSNRPSIQFDFSKAELDERFVYDETSPSCLRWRFDRFNKCKVKVASSGDCAGHLAANGYYVVKFNNRTIKIHRIIATIFNLDIENKFIDHINGCRSDNRLLNLRAVTPLENSHNKRISKNSSSGIPGVTYSARYDRWRASISYDDKEHCTYFSCKKHGFDAARDLAISYRLAQLNLLKENGVKYTDRHLGVEQEPEPDNQVILQNENLN